MTYEVDDDLYPASTGVYIEATWDQHGTFTGSGVLVGRNDILTAAHVIYSQNFGGLADEVRLYPSYDPDASDNIAVSWSYVDYYPDFDPDGDGRLLPGDFYSGTLGGTELDIALFTLSEPAGDIYGWMGLDYNFDGGQVGVLGYPGVYGRQPVYDEGLITPALFNDDAFYYNADLEVNPGNSGGPLFYEYGDGPNVAGLVSTGAAAVDVGGHQWWLVDAIKDNDAEFMEESGNLPLAEDFNALEYIASYRDLIAAFGADADAGADHYETMGRAEGRTISFDGLEYIASHDDLILAFGADAAHYINFGRDEGRPVSFDGLEYIASHDDLLLAFGADDDAGATHFINNGSDEGRARDNFDAQQYLLNYDDLVAAFGSDEDGAVLHYIEYGFSEGRVDDVLIG